MENVTLITANTETPHTLPTSTRTFKVRPRGAATLKLAYDLGTSGTVYWTITPGAWTGVDNVNPALPLTLYLQSPTAGAIAEIESWS